MAAPGGSGPIGPYPAGVGSDERARGVRQAPAAGPLDAALRAVRDRQPGR